MNEKKLFTFSILTGELFEIREYDLKLLELHHIPLEKSPKSGCKHCFGRGHMGVEQSLKYYIPCQCLKILEGFDMNNIKLLNLKMG